MKKEIDLKYLEATNKNYLSDDKHKILRHALSNTALNTVCTSFDNSQNIDFTFSIDIKTLPVCNQKHSGRCWIFSASTILREIINKKLHVKDQFEISQNFISYYDKLEKYNYYLTNVIDLVNKGEKKDGRKMHFLLSTGVGDGGQWDMYVSLIKKYGICPKSCFSETEQSNNTMLSTKLCNSALRKFASEIYKYKEEGKTEDDMLSLKEVYLTKIHSLLTDCFGLPPQSFDFEYIDKDGKYHIEKGLTPHSFFEKYVGEEIDEYVSIINAPTSDKKYNQIYNVELVGNVIGGKDITHLNVSYNRLEELIIKQLKDDEIVWFGSDVSYYGNRNNGSWDTSSYDYETPFSLDFKFDKAEMLDSYNSAMNHAMVITGVNLIDDKPTRWKIENSWGDDLGHKGYFTISEEWFKYFTYQAAIKKKYLNEEELKALEGKPILLSPWDPFGTLAD